MIHKINKSIFTQLTGQWEWKNRHMRRQKMANHYFFKSELALSQ